MFNILAYLSSTSFYQFILILFMIELILFIDKKVRFDNIVRIDFYINNFISEK